MSEIIQIEAMALARVKEAPGTNVQEENSCIKCMCTSWDGRGMNGELMYQRNFYACGQALPFERGRRYALQGTWSRPKQFQVSSVAVLDPCGQEDVLRYLEMGGIGKPTAKLLYQAFGDGVFSVLQNSPRQIFDVSGISKGRALRIVQGSSFLQTAQKLKKPGQKIPVKLGAAERIRLQAAGKHFLDDPDGEPLPAAKAREGKNELIETMRIAMADGHVCLPAAQIVSLTRKRVYCRDEVVDDQVLTNLLNELCQGEKSLLVREKLPCQSEYIYTRKALEAETYTALRLGEMKEEQALDQDAFAEALRRMNLKNGFAITAEQEKAVHMGLSQKFSVITGGPGTGKTTIIQYIVALYRQFYPGKTVLLCAPTGKAARRMSESAKETAFTIHSAFNLSVDGSETGKNKQKRDADFVIVDESSMVDIFLMQDLLQSIEDKTRLLLIGDANQLPSVGPGNVLKDLIASKKVPVTRLTQVKRQKGGSSIPYYANKIIQQRADILADKFPEDFRIVYTNSEEESQRLLARLYSRSVMETGIEQTVVLSPLRKKGVPTSCEDLNQLLQKLLNPEVPGAPKAKFRNKTFREKDRVMQTSNTAYAANGEVGQIVSLLDSGQAIVDFGSGQPVTVKAEDLEKMDLAYATTVHKSQGSEYKTVLISIQNSHGSLLQRNLLYTAITRAKEKVILVGERSAMEQAIHNISGLHRWSLLADRLQKA